jgi:hypothetical protein
MKNQTIYMLSLILCILILVCITLYFYLVKPKPLSYYSIEGFSSSACDKGACGKFLNKLCHYKNADTELGTLGPSTVDYDYNKVIRNKEELGAGLKNKYGDFTLCDFYIMTAYNCCASERFDGGESTRCALENAIRFGARCLDFEIYSSSGVYAPIISYNSKQMELDDGTLVDNHFAVSSNNKEDFTLDQALSIVKSNAFSGRKDPLILHFRIKTESKRTMNEMHDILVKHFNSGTIFNNRLLDKKYGKCGETSEYDINSIPIKDLMGKVIILVDNIGNKFKSTKLYNITNSSTGTFKDLDTFNSSFRNISITDLKNKGSNNPSSTELINVIEHYNKTRLTFVTPDKNQPINNIHDSDDMNLVFGVERGCQLIGMSFQQFDSSLQYYLNNLFASNSFSLKPKHLRAIPILMDNPEEQKQEQVDPADKIINISNGTDIVFPMKI